MAYTPSATSGLGGQTALNGQSACKLIQGNGGVNPGVVCQFECHIGGAIEDIAMAQVLGVITTRKVPSRNYT